MKEGYKLTELGMIPEDWQLKTFGDVMTGFSSGQTPSRAIPEYYKGDIRWITSGELNYNVITDTIEKITPEAVRRTNLKILPKGTFLIAITGLEAEGTRGSCGIVGEEATTNQSCMALYPKKELDNDYLRHFYVKYGNWLAFKYCQGTKQQSYTGKIARILPIVLPPTKEEQKAIAEALSDVDSLIISVERLIEKKKQIKQGAMQKLLEPKHEWTKSRLGKCLRFQVGFPFSSSYFNKDGEGVRLIKNRDLKSDDTTVYYKGSYDNEFIVNNGDVLIGMDGEFIPALWKKGHALLNQRVGRLVPFKKVDLKFLFYYLRNPLKQIQERTGSTTVKHLTHSDIENIEIPLPSISTQTEIADILFGMDNEISALEKKLKKARQLKEGMMQDLLTGKKRLV